jgi:hypothetical protein
MEHKDERVASTTIRHVILGHDAMTINFNYPLIIMVLAGTSLSDCG